MLLNILFLLLVQTTSLARGFTFEGCGTTKSCWFHPPHCESKDIEGCVSSVQWTVLSDGVLFELEAVASDLDLDSGHYVALGFSKDTRMGDDSVLECVFGLAGGGKAYVSFNDETHNFQLHQATAVMINESSLSEENGNLKCAVKWMFGGRKNVNPGDRFKVFDLESRPWHLLFVRGDADKYSLQKKIHFLNDGAQFPWTSTQQIEFCRGNCTTDPFVVVSNMKQTDLSRYWRYRFAVMHGTFLLLAWWVLGSSAILVARYFKPLWPRKKLLGTAVWFQIHRDLNIASVTIQAVAVFLIIYQAGRLYECSYVCTLEDWYKKMHVITGIGTMGFALLQPFLAFARPGPNSVYRPIFNWSHWFLGMLAWTLASTTILLSVPLGKTGLMLRYGHVPTWIMAGYILTFLVCNVVLEILSASSPKRTEKIGPTGMALSVINGPSTESPVAKPGNSTARIVVFAVHLVVALGVSITITVLLVRHLLSHSP